MSNSLGGEIPSHILSYKNILEVDKSSLYLSDLSPRDKYWDTHRSNSDRVADHYRDDVIWAKYADKIDFCAQVLDFRLVPQEGEYKLKLDNARFCRVRHCPVCQWRRSLMWKAKAYKVLPNIVGAYPKYRWLFLTLTVSNCPASELKNTLQWMNQSWQRLIKRKKFPGVGWLRSTEVTRGKDNSAHPHFHCLLLVKPSYFRGQAYIKQNDWSQLWKSCLRVDYLPVIDIRSLKVSSSPNDLVPEIIKYCVKETDLVVNREWFLELTRQMYKVRTIATGGVLKKYFKELEQEPEDLIGKDESGTKSELDEGRLYFNWKYKDKRYRL